MTQNNQPRIPFRLSQFGTTLVTRDQGIPIREQLLVLLNQGKQIEVIFDGVEALTPSFVDEVLGKALVVLGIDRFRNDVTLVAQSQEHRRLANLVLSNRTPTKTS